MIRGRPKERGRGQRDFSRSKSKGRKSTLKCWFCGKYGHLNKDCWKRQQASKEDPPKETKEAQWRSFMYLYTYCSGRNHIYMWVAESTVTYVCML
jgi:hypothetical protein